MSEILCPNGHPADGAVCVSYKCERLEEPAGWSYTPIGPNACTLGPDDRLVCPACMMGVNSDGAETLAHRVRCPNCRWAGLVHQCLIARPVDWEPLNIHTLTTRGHEE